MIIIIGNSADRLQDTFLETYFMQKSQDHYFPKIISQKNPLLKIKDP